MKNIHTDDDDEDDDDDGGDDDDDDVYYTNSYMKFRKAIKILSLKPLGCI